MIALRAFALLIPFFTIAASADTAMPTFQPLADLRAAAPAFGDTTSQLTLASGVGAFFAARQFDPMMRDAYVDQHRLGDWDRFGNDVLGTGIPGALLGAALWAGGYSGASAHEVHAGISELESMLATAIATGALKVSVHRERPNGRDFNSFPSGHTSTMAATAMSLQEFYGWRAGVPAFVLTGFTALCRVSADAHWLSDTVAGATLGIWIAHSFAQAHQDRAPAASQSSLLPVPVDGGGQIVFSTTY